jgi:hypothetical protein
VVKNFAPLPQQHNQQVIDKIQLELAKPHFQEIQAEYETVKKRAKRKPEWYRLFGGPSNLRDLANHLDQLGRYMILYPQWSSISHAHDAARFAPGTTITGDFMVRHLRQSRDIPFVVGYAATFMLHATRLVLRKFRPGEEQHLADWYKKEVQERFRELTGANS